MIMPVIMNFGERFKGSYGNGEKLLHTRFRRSASYAPRAPLQGARLSSYQKELLLASSP